MKKMKKIWKQNKKIPRNKNQEIIMITNNKKMLIKKMSDKNVSRVEDVDMMVKVIKGRKSYFFLFLFIIAFYFHDLSILILQYKQGIFWWVFSYFFFSDIFYYYFVDIFYYYFILSSLHLFFSFIVTSPLESLTWLTWNDFLPFQPKVMTKLQYLLQEIHWRRVVGRLLVKASEELPLWC